jgi:VWFA-related protein
MWNMAGMWSSGQFDGNLRAIFHPGNHAVFAYARPDQVGAHPALVFTYSISRQNEPLWELRAEDQLAAPPYEGELWLDAETGDVLRFRSTSSDMPPQFPIRSAEIRTEYDNVAFPDGSRFLLPVKAEVATRYRDASPIRNIVEFRGCHKFRATAHMITGLPDQEDGVGQFAARESFADIETELDENQKIYTILREEAIREDALRMAIEQQQDLRAATGAAFFRLAQLSDEREKRLAANPRSLRPVSESELVPDSNGSASFRVNVKLVPVTVVVRDNKGRALGNLNQQDFQLFDNRKPQEITSFLLQGSATKDAAEGSPKVGAKPILPNSVAYVFDDLHTSSSDLAKAAVAADRQLARLRPPDRAAIFTTSGDVIADFTPNQDQLRAALHKIKSHANAMPTDCPEMSYFTADLIVRRDVTATELALEDAGDCLLPNSGIGTPGRLPGGALDMAQKEVARKIVVARAGEVVSVGRMESDRAVSILFEAFNRTLRMSGHRTIVLLSPGFLTLDPNQQQAIMHLIERALQSDIVISGIDVRGLSAIGAAKLTGGPMNAPAVHGTLDSQGDSATEGVMADLAYGTGGNFFHNNNDLDRALRQTTEAPEYFYVIGFSPQKLDGKLHKLKIKVSGGEKLTVQARSGYYALRPSPTH